MFMHSRFIGDHFDNGFYGAFRCCLADVVHFISLARISHAPASRSTMQAKVSESMIYVHDGSEINSVDIRCARGRGLRQTALI